jgi:hypothetical protein
MMVALPVPCWTCSSTPHAACSRAGVGDVDAEQACAVMGCGNLNLLKLWCAYVCYFAAVNFSLTCYSQ